MPDSKAVLVECLVDLSHPGLPQLLWLLGDKAGDKLVTQIQLRAGVLIMGTPAALSFGTQALLVALADLFQHVAHTIEVRDLPAHLSQLIGMDAKLTGFTTGIITFSTHWRWPLPLAQVEQETPEGWKVWRSNSGGF
jgi:hypothetical protein